ncbi:hypothetical protein EV194_1046 [Natronoflexus pectinivorans]|uniref:Uncharacterized protein n=1 Tax=Natronoflexus pectinivorans TaxID=682526 RepID=A0A4R2GJR7_9BACT|nr:hypothetical protein EV194_1046 [Natronoflexus pectinivorans]
MKFIYVFEKSKLKTLSISEYRLKGNAKEVLRYRQALWKGFHKIIDKSLSPLADGQNPARRVRHYAESSGR